VTFQRTGSSLCLSRNHLSRRDCSACTLNLRRKFYTIIALNTSILTHPKHSRASSLRSLDRSRFKPTFLARRDAPVSPDS